MKQIVIDESVALASQFCEGWEHFMNCIDFSRSFLDGEAIAWMNEISMKESSLKEKMEGTP